MFASQIFKVTYISALFGLKIWPFKTTYYKEGCPVRFGFPRQSLQESVGCGKAFKRSAFQCRFTRYPASKRLMCQMRRKWTADNPYKIIISDRKWVCVHVWQTGICHVNVWRFKSCGVFPPCTVWKTEERLEDIRGGLFGGEQCLSMPTSILLVTDQDNSFPKQRSMPTVLYSTWNALISITIGFWLFTFSLNFGGAVTI